MTEPSFAPEPITTDAVIIGAGCAGLFAAFELGIMGLRSHIVETLPHAGGQCVHLYGDKPIYDIPAILQCTGNELTERLLEQIRPFKADLHLQQTVTALKTRDAPEKASDPAPRFELHTSTGQCFLTRCVVIASGYGAFLPRTLPLEGIRALENQQVFYELPAHTDAYAGKHVVINGDTDIALQAASQLASAEHSRPASVTLVHRRDKFRAEDTLITQIQQLRQAGRLQFIAGQFTGLVTDAASGQLTALQLMGSTDRQTQQIPADAFLILLGLAPQLGPIEQWGLALERKHLVVDPGTFQTNIPGIYAIGDAITYPGKRKLIVSGFHEATLAAYAIASYLQDGATIPVYYTSSNSELQAILAPQKAGHA